MDTSKEYIKMCEKAEEIQKLSKGYFGDNYSYFVDRKWRRLVLNKIPNEDIWLPRQDQLQEMVGDYNSLRKFWRWITEIGWDCCDFRETMVSSYSSMEQLWLAFVMKEKFNKTWDGENWIV